MRKLTNNEMKKVKGGSGLGITLISLGIVMVISIVIGAVEGYVHPQPCGGKEDEKTDS